MLKYIIIIIPLALLSFGLATACVLMEKSEYEELMQTLDEVVAEARQEIARMKGADDE